MKICVEECRDLDIRYIAEHCIEGNPDVSSVAVLPDETNATLIQGSNTEDTSITEGTVKYDVRFNAIIPRLGERIHLIVNTEAQIKFNPGYPLVTRAVYYCSRMLSSQYGTVFTHGDYGKLRKVYSIFICKNAPKQRQHTITSYQITEKPIIGNVTEEVRHYDLLTVVMICLGDPDQAETGSLLYLLDALFAKNVNAEKKMQILQDIYHIPMTQELERQVSQMCNLSEGILEEGRQEGRQETANRMLAKGASLDFIHEITQIPIEELKVMQMALSPVQL
jgi:predicted transposase/invertase (TIGR01784 family)